MLEKALYEVKRFEGIFEKFQTDINQILQEQFEALHATKLKLLMELGLHPPSEENIKISSTTLKRSVSSEEE
jgi:phosphatidate phosphatase PAH1